MPNKRPINIQRLIKVSIKFAELLYEVKQTGGPKADILLQDFASKGWFQRQIVDEYVGANRKRRSPPPSKKQNTYEKLRTSISSKPYPGGKSLKR